MFVFSIFAVAKFDKEITAIDDMALYTINHTNISNLELMLRSKSVHFTRKDHLFKLFTEFQNKILDINCNHTYTCKKHEVEDMFLCTNCWHLVLSIEVTASEDYSTWYVKINRTQYERDGFSSNKGLESNEFSCNCKHVHQVMLDLQYHDVFTKTNV